MEVRKKHFIKTSKLVTTTWKRWDHIYAKMFPGPDAGSTENGPWSCNKYAEWRSEWQEILANDTHTVRTRICPSRRAFRIEAGKGVSEQNNRKSFDLTHVELPLLADRASLPWRILPESAASRHPSDTSVLNSGKSCPDIYPMGVDAVISLTPAPGPKGKLQFLRK